MINLLKKLFPICRSITGEGLYRSLIIMKSTLKKNDQKSFKIFKIKSGTRCYDWKFPQEWVIRDAYLKFKNKKILDFKKNNLHVINYSYPINLKNVSLKNIKKYLFFDKTKKKQFHILLLITKKKLAYV